MAVRAVRGVCLPLHAHAWQPQERLACKRLDVACIVACWTTGRQLVPPAAQVLPKKVYCFTFQLHLTIVYACAWHHGLGGRLV